MIRLLDILFSFLGLLILLPVLILLFIIVKIDSRGPAIFRQQRVGKNDRDFILFKFRTMYTHSDRAGLLTIGANDSRVTRSGAILRKFKLDELPQLWNVLVGDMSLVGPRPEVRKYVKLYTKEQRRVLRVKPGITDLASIKYKNENDLLAGSVDPEEMYVKVIMPDKIRLNMEYINEPSVKNYFRITLKTLHQMVKS